MRKLLVMSLAFGVGAVYAAPKKKVKSEKQNSAQVEAKVSQKVNLDPTLIHNGLRLSAGFGNQTIELEVEDDIRRASEDTSATANVFSIGYQKLRNASMEYMVALTRSSYTLDWDLTGDADVTHWDIEGNLTYGINTSLYTYGGINIQTIDFNSSDDDVNEAYNDFETGAGFQVALGYQFNKNIAAELKYKGTSFSQTRKSNISGDSYDYTYGNRGTQINLIGTF